MRSDVAGTVFTDGGETSTFNDTGAAATAGDPETGIYSEVGSPDISFVWYVEAATCAGCTHNYLVLYSDDTLDADLPVGFSFRETSALTDITGSNYSFVHYSEQSNYGDMVRAMAADAEIWNSVSVLQ